MKRTLAALILLIILACVLSCAHAQEVPQACRFVKHIGQ